MKTYWQHTPDERGALTRAQVEALVPIQLMEAGVTPPPPLELEDEAAPVLEEQQLFEVVDVSTGYRRPTGTCFESQDEAAAFVEDSGARIIRRDYGSPDQVDLAPRFAIEAVRVPPIAAVEDAKNEVQRAQAAARRNEVRRKEHARRTAEVTEATKALWADWHEQVERLANRGAVVARFEEYVRLCDGDAVVARRFLLKVHSTTEVDDALGVALPEQAT